VKDGIEKGRIFKETTTYIHKNINATIYSGV
jgi:hypothetical protein